MNHPFLALLGASGSALAFPAAQYWHMSAAGDVPNGDTYDPQGVSGNNRAGAGGIYGSGGARDFGIKCSHCHVETPPEPYGLVDLDIQESPAWQNVAGDDAYSPGQTYTFTLTLQNEHRFSPYGGNDQNGFTVAIEDANGSTAGVYVTDSGSRSDACPPSTPAAGTIAGRSTFVYGDCHAVLSVMEIRSPAITQWTFDWIAPAAGTGDLTLFWSVVDGDTAGESSYHDDAREGTIALREGT